MQFWYFYNLHASQKFASEFHKPAGLTGSFCLHGNESRSEIIVKYSLEYA